MKKITHSRIVNIVCFAMLSISSFGQTGYFQNFNTGGLPAGFTTESSYAISTSNQSLRLLVNKANLFHAVAIDFPSALNLSTAANRKVSFRIRTDTTTRNLPYEINLTMFNAGITNASGFRRTNKIIYPTGNWQTISMDFNDAAFTANFGAITQMNIILQPLNYMEGANVVFIDDIAIGDNGTPGQAAIAAPYFLGIPNQQIPINTSFTYKIRNAFDADNLNSNITFTAASSNTTVLPNPTFTNSPFLSNSYFPFTSGNGTTGDLQTSRTVNMVMTPATNQFGMVTVTVTATAASQIAGKTTVPYRYVFSVDVRRNIAPTIGIIPTSLTIGSDRSTDIFLSNIFSGNGEASQTMTISGLSSDQTILLNSQIVTSFNGIAMSGIIKLNPIAFSSPASKTFNLTVNISDNGGIAQGGSNQTNYVIPITILPTYFNAPTIGVIPNQIDNIITQGPRTIRIEPITDGNGGSRISSVTAVSGNTNLLANPAVSYTIGNNFALLTYNANIVGTTNISVTATNFGAPANSNGNSSFTRVFVMTALDPPQAGFVEPMIVTSVVGPADADGRSSTVAGTWFVENQGTQQNVTINSGTNTFTNVMNKAGTAPGYFSGVWYKPQGGGDLFDFASFPYLSVDLSAASGTPSSVAIDLWDVNGIRYGLTSSIPVNASLTTYTFCYTGTPTVGFDFSKVKTILFNFGVTPYNNGTGSWDPYAGTITMKNLRLGSSAIGSGSCVAPVPVVEIGTAPNPFFTSSQTGTKTITITGINAGSTPITGKNSNPVNLSANGSFSPSVISFNASAGVAVIQYTTGGVQTGNINVVGSAVGSTSFTRTFSVTVQAVPGTINNVVVTNDLNANFADGQKGQTIDGSPFGICEIFGAAAAGLPDSYYDMLKEVNMQSMRIGIWDFEPKNDNNDPFVLDKTKLDYDAMQVEFFKKASDAGVKRFFATFFSPPSFTKYNNEYGVPNAPFTLAPGFVVNNTVDSAYYEEYAEYAVAFVQGVKEKSGVDIYGLSLGNEIQFNQTYQSVVLNTTQYVEIVRRVGRRLAAAGLKTFIWGAETLQGQDAGNDYLKACQADPEVRNYLAGYAIHAYASNGVGQANPSWGNVVTDSRDSRSNGGLALLRQNAMATVGPGGEPHNGNGGSGIPIYQTETSQGGVANVEEWDNALGIFGGVTSSLNVGKNSGWYYIGITRDYKMFYTYKHIDKYVFGGARAIPVTPPTGTSASAFRNPDNSVCVIFATDNSGGMRTFSFGGANMPTINRAFVSTDEQFWQDLGTISGSITLAPNSIVTLWGGGNALVAANGVTISGGNTVNIAGGNIPFTAIVGPSNLVDKSVIWSVVTTTGAGIIDQNGLFTASKNGLVTVRATSVNTPSVFSQRVVTITGQYEPVTGLTINGVGGVKTISTQAGTLSIVGIFAPLTASNTAITWSVFPVSGRAIINSSGLLTALTDGNATITGVSQDNITVTSRIVVTISGQGGAVTSATISGVGGVNQITAANGTLQMTTTGFSPSNATTGITPSNWILLGSTFGNTIGNATGIIQSANNGNGTITVQANFGAVLATRIIVVSGQNIPVTIATISGLGGVNQITSANGQLQMTTTGLAPLGANQNTVPTWSVLAPSLGNTIGSGGLLQASSNSNGTITVQANFGGVIANRIVVISGQNIPLISAVIDGVGSNQITVANATLQMSVTGLNPVNANQNIIPTWSIQSATLGNTINASGLISSATNSNGVITIQAAFGAINAFRAVTISGQNIPVTSGTISGFGGVNQITIANGTLQMTTVGFSPSNSNTGTAPTNWILVGTSFGNSIDNVTGIIQSNPNGNGTITVQANFGLVLVTRTVVISGQNIPLNSAVINGVSGNTITVNQGTLQMTVTGLSPVNANQNTVAGWSLLGSPAQASINGTTGLISANANAIVTVQAAFGAIVSTRIVTISNQLTGIVLTSASAVINTNNGTLQMTPVYTPVSASSAGVSYALSGSFGTISGTGLITALFDGVLTVTATSLQNGLLQAVRIVSISGQSASIIQVTSATLGAGNTIANGSGNLVLTATVGPANASNPTINWSLSPTFGIASIAGFTSTSVTLTPLGNGVFTLSGVSVSNSSITVSRVITVSGFPIPVTSTTVNGTGGTNQIATTNGTLQMLAPYNPANANQNTLIGWSFINISGTNSNTFNAGTGLLTAGNDGNGIVTITGTYGVVSSTRLVTISGQRLTATAMTITGNNITTQGGTSQMMVSYFPVGASLNTTVGWTSSNASIATIGSSNGLVSAVSNGTITITGTTGSIVVNKVIVVSGQFVGIPVSSTTVNGTGGVNQITVVNATLQMTAPFSPANANQNTILGWTFNNVAGTNSNSFNGSTGVLTAGNDGNGVVTIVGNYGAVASTRLVTISGQRITSTAMTITGNNITTPAGTSQLTVIYHPIGASLNTTVGWTSSNTSIATVGSNNGLVSAVANGTVTITGAAGSIVVSKVIVISGQVLANPVSSATISGANVLSTKAGTVQYNSVYGPTNADASTTVIGWSLLDPTSKNTITAGGLLQGAKDGNGVVTVVGTYGSFSTYYPVTISGQDETIKSITLTGTNSITAPGGFVEIATLFNSQNVNGIDRNLIFTLLTTTGGGKATLGTSSANNSYSIRVTALQDGNGLVTIVGTSNVNSTITSIFVISISGQVVPISSLTISASSNVITANAGSLQLSSTIFPTNGNQEINWMLNNSILGVIGGTSGLLTALDNGVLTVTAFVGNRLTSTVTSNFVVTITGQLVRSFSILPASDLITAPFGTKQLSVINVFPANAENKNDEIVWTISSNNLAGVGKNGLVMAANNGNSSAGVTVTGTLKGTSISSQSVIKIDGQGGNNQFIINAVNPKLKIDASSQLYIYKVKSNSIGLIKIDNLGNATALNGGNGTATFITMLASDTTLRFERNIAIQDQSTSLGLNLLDAESNTIDTPIKIGAKFFIQTLLAPFSTQLSDKYLYETSSIDIVSLDSDGNGTALAFGVATINVTYLNNPTLKGSITVTVGGVLGNETNEKLFLENNITLSPNPTHGLVNIQTEFKSGYDINVYNALGILIIAQKSNSSNFNLDLSNNPTGIYNVVILKNNVVYSKKVSLR